MFCGLDHLCLGAICGIWGVRPHAPLSTSQGHRDVPPVCHTLSCQLLGQVSFQSVQNFQSISETYIK